MVKPTSYGSGCGDVAAGCRLFILVNSMNDAVSNAATRSARLATSASFVASTEVRDHMPIYDQGTTVPCVG